MISPAVIDKVFDVAAIEEVVGEYVTLKRAGSNFKGLCPFHDDKNPSMSVSPSKGIYKCFSCQKGGNVVQFIMEHEGMSYPLAIKFLADRYNIEIAEDEIDISQLEDEARQKEAIYACLEFAKNHFASRLQDSQDGKVIYKPYLSERGIGAQSIETFSIGLSGVTRNHLLSYGLSSGYTTQQLFDAGLVKKIDEEASLIESNLRDTFIERIVFPIYNIAGKVLGFGGRIIKKETKAPKYLNSPETLVYEKRKQLYGLSVAKNEIRIKDNAYVVEGYMDVVSLAQNGVNNVVAVSGTAFTDEQARLLKRFTRNITLLFDGDEAGINASLKHISTLLKSDLNVSVVLFPEGEDPDSYMQKNGLSAFEKFVEETKQNFVDFIAEVKLKQNGDDPLAKAQAARSIAESISFIPDPLKRAAFVHEAAKKLEISERIINEETNKFRHTTEKRSRNTSIYKPTHIEPVPVEIEKKEDTNYQERELLCTLILHADKEFNEEQNVAQFIFSELDADEVWPSSEEYGTIFKTAHEQLVEAGTLNELYFIRNPETSKLAADILSKNHTLSEGWKNNFDKFVKTDIDNYKNQVAENLNFLKLKFVDLKMVENQEKLKQAETEEDIMIFQNIHINLQQLRARLTEQSGTVIIK